MTKSCDTPSPFFHRFVTYSWENLIMPIGQYRKYADQPVHLLFAAEVLETVV